MKRYLFALLLMALPLAAQEEKKPEVKAAPAVQKIIVLKYADPNQLANLLMVFGALIRPSPDMHALAITATEVQMTAIQDAIQRLDTPAAAPKNVELTVYYLVGSEGGNPVGMAPLPKDLDNVVTQLKTAFAFKNYGLLDILTLRTRTGRRVHTTSSAGPITLDTPPPAPVIIMFGIDSVMTDNGTVRMDGLQSQITGLLKTPLETRADIDIKEGQKVVVGQLGLRQGQAIFLVLTAKIL